MKNLVGRRNLLAISGLALGSITTARFAYALTPPAPPPPTLEDEVRSADFIFVGTFEQFVFRGHSDKLVPTNEFNRDFEADNGEGNRSLNGFVRIGRVLKNVMPKSVEIPSVIRLQGPVPSDDYLSYLHREMIIFSNQGVLIGYGEELKRIFGTTRLPLQLTEESKIIQLIDRSGAAFTR